VKILQILNIANFTLAIYYTPGLCYQYCIIDPEGIVYNFEDIFYTAEAAEREGRESVNVALNL
jgi:hypothetical protein